MLDAFLSELRKSKPTERVVVVSNFISTLDTVHVSIHGEQNILGCLV